METVGDVMTSKKVFYAREDTTIDEGKDLSDLDCLADAFLSCQMLR